MSIRPPMSTDRPAAATCATAPPRADGAGAEPVKAGAETYSSAIVDASNYTRWVVDLFRRHIGRRLVEVGLGHGRYRDHLGALDAYVGLDIDEASIAAMRAADPAGEYHVEDVASPGFAERLGVGRFDTALCVNVLEHVEDHAAALRGLARVLAPGGRLCLFVPAHPRLYGEMDRLAGHCRRYTIGMVRSAMPAELRVRSIRYVNPIGGLGWWVNRRKGYTTLDDDRINAQIRFFDRWVLPMSRAMTPITARVFGQSVACVAERVA